MLIYWSMIVCRSWLCSFCVTIMAWLRIILLFINKLFIFLRISKKSNKKSTFLKLSSFKIS
jgi:hypothetical protein